ncbi:MAG: hypothetical protein JO256_08855 [Alphaproteobacteria bacterium]|nr:hypothetical protein [Alphaproteobacteria bacterium]
MNTPRRSAGMRGDPRNPRAESEEISNTLPPRHDTPADVASASLSRYPKPKVLMGEVAAPRGQSVGEGREAFRAFMLRQRLVPSRWARDAGVPIGEVMAYLTGRTRHLSPEIVIKLAKIAGVRPEKMFTE